MTTLSRRNFLKGLLSSVAAAALVKNGVVQAEQALAEPERKVFDMGANTWREEHNYWVWLGENLDTIEWPSLRPLWPMEAMPPFHVNCRCTLTNPLRVSQELIDDGWITIATMPSKPNWVSKPQPRGILSTAGIAELWRIDKLSRGQA